MIQQHQLLSVESTRRAQPLQQLWQAISFLAARVAGWTNTVADYYAAAAIYEQLSRLSDAELKRRGLSRATLARDIGQAHDTAAR